MTEKLEIPSPCVAVCQMDDNDEYCIGCFRTREEITHWIDYDAETKSRVLALLEERRNHHDSQC